VRFDSVIWDWNGTLLNDVTVAIESINHLLIKRKLFPITLERYLEVFTFPVQDYYELIGFDFQKEPFDVPAMQFIRIYAKEVEKCGLHEEVVPILKLLAQGGYRQFILSAMEQQQLEKTVAENDIRCYFEDLCGLDDHYAKSKVDNGKLLIRSKGLKPDRALLVGDTVHDYEVAQAIGCRCVLVAKGHQSKERLLQSGADVVDSLTEIEF